MYSKNMKAKKMTGASGAKKPRNLAMKRTGTRVMSGKGRKNRRPSNAR